MSSVLPGRPFHSGFPLLLRFISVLIPVLIPVDPPPPISTPSTDTPPGVLVVFGFPDGMTPSHDLFGSWSLTVLARIVVRIPMGI